MKTLEEAILFMEIQANATAACTVAARMRKTTWLAMSVCLIAAGMATAAAQAPAVEAAAAASPDSDPPMYIAGTAPDHRRTDIPVIKEAPVLDKKIAFHGIDEPYPASLRVFDSQGAWYTPFTHPGMTGVYDLRGYHHPKDQSQ
uniref:hypothetical protein n=1 Tax=Castellaniella defragrans TaxID=75697 RepID=UPI00333F1485